MHSEFGDFLSYIVSFGGVMTLAAGLIYGTYKTVTEIFSIKRKKKIELQETFNQIVTQLTSDSKTVQLSAAILLRRFFNNSFKNQFLKKETLDVISSLSRVLPSGVFQKTLVDGLPFALDLSNCDLQKTNLQDAYLGVKDGYLIMNKTDLFLADLSYALIQNVVGHEIIFYRAILLGTQIKDCDFTNANFRNADLTHTTFKNVTLKGADFNGAYNIPEYIKSKLIDGVFQEEGKVTTANKMSEKNIFFSMPGIMAKEDEMLTNYYKQILEQKGFNVIYYNRDLYPSFGQFNRVRESILRSSGMIAFGLKQIYLKYAIYRPETIDAKEWRDKWLSTPWSEIEVGMALMRGLPILLVCDPDINYGVFDIGLSECFISHISTKIDSKTIEQNKDFDNWLSKI